MNASINPENDNSKDLIKDQNTQVAVSYFEKMLDETCVKLQKKNADYTLQKLNELDTLLSAIEADLDRFQSN